MALVNWEKKMPFVFHHLASNAELMQQLARAEQHNKEISTTMKKDLELSEGEKSQKIKEMEKSQKQWRQEKDELIRVRFIDYVV